MSHWMGLHFLWIDYNNLSGYIFIRVTRMGPHIFGILRLRNFCCWEFEKIMMCEFILG